MITYQAYLTNLFKEGEVDEAFESVGYIGGLTVMVMIKSWIGGSKGNIKSC